MNFGFGHFAASRLMNTSGSSQPQAEARYAAGAVFGSRKPG
jgi:hypothetical protein